MSGLASAVWLGVALTACGSGGSGANDAGPSPDAPAPGDYDDPMVRLAEVPRQGGGVSHPQQMIRGEAGELFYCGSPGGLYRVDISDPAAPVAAAPIRPAGGRSCQHLARSGDLVFATARGDEIAPPSVSGYDTSGGGQPTSLGAFTQADLSYEGIAADGMISFVAVHGDGLLVLDWSSGAPLEIASLAAGFVNAWGLSLVGTTLFVADAGAGLVVVNVSNPAAPSIIGSLSLEGSPQTIASNGTTAFLAMSTAGIAVVDVSQPSAPALLQTLDTPGSATEISLDGELLAVADWNDFRVYDVSEPSATDLVATEVVLDSQRSFTRFLGTAIVGNIVIAGEFNGSLFTYRVFPDRIAPDVRLEASALTFARTDPGEQDAIALIVRNEGRAPLVLTSIGIEGAVFSTAAAPFGLAVGGATVIELLYSPESGSEDSGTLTVTTDDPDEASLEVALSGNGSSIQVGDAAPEVEVALLGGGTWRLSEQAGKVTVLAYFATF